jgi:hypothetical protein
MSDLAMREKNLRFECQNRRMKEKRNKWASFGKENNKNSSPVSSKCHFGPIHASVKSFDICTSSLR